MSGKKNLYQICSLTCKRKLNTINASKTNGYILCTCLMKKTEIVAKLKNRTKSSLYWKLTSFIRYRRPCYMHKYH